VRSGNRDFKKEHFSQAEIDYKRALIKDTLSNAANFNLGNTYYRLENYKEADKYYGAVIDSLDRAGKGADGYYNIGNSYLKQREWSKAVDAFKNSLRRSPNDMDAKSNLAYAQKMLENEQQQQNQDQNQNKDQNQDQSQDNKQNQNQDQDQDQNNNENQDQDKDQDKNQDQDKDQDQNRGQSQQQDQQPKISPQAAQQMLQAIQDKEKDTQEKVNREKALQMQSKQKEKNW
jgi:tetratricopeptide (TPR) repeat protein